ncbi:hypothetical protein ACROYT_G027337 [Oculina patagonica]
MLQTLLRRKRLEQCKHSLRANGAQLVKIESTDENDFIKKEFLALEVNYWIGLTDAETENDWKWSDGSELTGYINWRSGQPNDYQGQDCGVIFKGMFSNSDIYDGEWHDGKCSTVRGSASYEN